uniref:Uracil phosphoribosyltransferase homolog n=3 Tax=Schistocephalus solidus TaxID=70667 RepID=A0A0X3NHL5_SCHSO
MAVEIMNGEVSTVNAEDGLVEPAPEVSEILKVFSKNIILLPPTDELREMQTVLRDKKTTRNDFVFYANRLIRLVMEEGLNQLPFEEVTVITPTGHKYNGLKFLKGNCGVSIVRSGEAMERGLRDCCRAMRIGKILIHTPEESPPSEAQVVYAKLPPGVHLRKILLMYPILHTGTAVLKAIDLLRSYNVSAENIILETLFASPSGVRNVLARNPALTIVTSEIHSVVPWHFEHLYFGTV